MPHDFDHVVSVARAAPDTDNAELGLVETGPDSDEVWDVLSIYWECVLSAEAEDIAPSFLEAWFQLDIGADLLVNGNEVATAFGPVEDHRVIDGCYLQAQQTVEDETNTLGLGGEVGQYSQAMHFDRGDLRVAFPGEFQTQASLANVDTIPVSLESKVSIHYAPSPRHQ